MSEDFVEEVPEGAPSDLIEQCAMWCELKGYTYRHIPYDQVSGFLVRVAISEYRGVFASLNTTQRQYIASLKE